MASTKLAEVHMGWKPKYSELEYIIETAWQWRKSVLKDITLGEEHAVVVIKRRTSGKPK